MTREEAIKWVKFVHDVLYEDKDEDIRTALDIAIEALHREEAEEKGWCHRIIPKNVEVVVRCKDCKWYKACKVFSNNAWHDDDYCSWGERREP